MRLFQIFAMPTTVTEPYPVSAAEVADAARRFTFTGPESFLPRTESQRARCGELRTASHKLALDMLAMCPRSRELGAAIEKLEEACDFATAAIVNREPTRRKA